MGTTDDGYRLLVKSKLCELLDLLKIGVAYERAEGNTLFYPHPQSGRPVPILDLVGGYGSLLFGHNHPVLVAEARNFFDRSGPMFAQGSHRRLAGQLASKLASRFEKCRAVFCNSGTEAVEAALKHAMLERRAKRFIALHGGFHGKTLGSLQLTANPYYRAPFEMNGLSIHRVRPNDLEGLEAAFENDPASIAGFLFEPIQGEGGIRPLTSVFLRRAAELCSAHGIPLMADECQTGMGRTGRFFACEHAGIKPDYAILSKSFGGGLAKISALLIHSDRYQEEFELLHTSTFSEDDYSCAIALRALELLEQERVLERCRQKGEFLRSELEKLKRAYPSVIADVRGLGLMMGIEFVPQTRSKSFMLRLLSHQEDLGYVLCGYLFNAHQIRLAPTLSDKFTLRVEPSAFIEEEELARFVHALADACHRIRRGDALGLTRYFIGERPENETLAVRDTSTLEGGEGELPRRSDFFIFNEPQFWRREKDAPAIRVAWLCHLVDAKDLRSLEGSFARIPFEKCEEYLRHLTSRAHPIVMNSTNIRSKTGQELRFHAILLPFTSRRIKEWLLERKLERPQEAVEEAIGVARSLGSQVVALGQYTSIVTRNGTTLRIPDMAVTTGNSYALALGLEAIRRAQEERGVDPSHSTLAVVGASGNIGSVAAELLAGAYQRVILVGSDRPESRARLDALGRRLNHPHLEWTTDPQLLREAHVVFAATNAPIPTLFSHHIHHGAIVCDLSVPMAVAPEVRSERPDLLLMKGGIARLPYGEDLEVAGFPLPRGQTFGCMAEGFLLGFEGVRDTFFTGSLTAEHIRRVDIMARIHGFELAEYKVTDVLGFSEEQRHHVSAY